MKRNKLVIGVLTTALLLTGCAAGGPGSKAPEKEAEELVKIPVEVERVELTNINESFYNLGTVEAGRTYTLNALVSADVEDVYVQVGDVVQKGDLLYTLEMDDFKTNRTSQLSGVKTQLDSAKIQRDSAQKSYNDTKILYDQGAVSKSALTQTEDALESAQISYNNALTSYNTTQSTLSSSEEKYIVTSPIDGIVTARSVEEGQFATTQNGMTVSEYNPVKISFSVPGARIDEAFVGQVAHIDFPTQDLSLEAKLSTLNLSGKGGGYPAEIELDNTDQKFLPGMIAEVYLETNRVEEAVVVMKNTVLEDEMGAYVFVVVGDNAQRVEVTRGLEDGDLVQIIGSISENDQIVIKGQQYLKDQDLVLVK